eukprot:snap_masked-scaffold_4-processed-gene-1.11-mRNA-1 protein AED:1.00 eAED:1.00 QI:0/-1/0/0/-1/1/1/0/78
MSVSRAWAVFGTTCAATIGTIGFVHWKQEFDKEEMKQNVIREILLEEFERKTAEHTRQKEASSCETGICNLKTTNIID